MGDCVLLGVTGGIAAYKIPNLVRLITSAKMNVNVVMTQNATNFVTPLTLATLSGSNVSIAMWDHPDRPSVEHIELADKADVAVIAPATANFIGKMANGIADDLLTTITLALKCPMIICPSMNVNMFENPIVRQNIKKLESVGYHVMAPDSGFLACGWTGPGRMPEPEAIFEQIEYF
ncbi:MAG: flavoprotein, partial [Syntrophaceae bacterium]|nr:flavoprotein [Syntrophaceae bacterium]